MDIYIQEANHQPERIVDFPVKQLGLSNLRLPVQDGYRNFKVLSRFEFGDMYVLKVQSTTDANPAPLSAR